ncbi:GNAT family N-acetyltransferase [Streptomyces hoynatensis]|uniref:GNAT family N-acetyltransferase n=1 Tax=Streptomyces hoynatensis TaxID=1141874 RepID=UPI001F4E8ADA|nr:GNAT family N-acetyltransferase [Streptomyces hoynatensis]
MELRTERLVLRGWRDEDLDPLAAMDADPEVMRYIADGSVRSREQTAATLERMRQGWEEAGYGLFALQLRETGEFAGWTGLAVPRFLPEVLPAVEIGWRLPRALWGRGLATEAARAVLEFGFARVGLEGVVSICRVENRASARVMEKLGMRLDRETELPVLGLRVRVCALSRAEYEANGGVPASGEPRSARGA